MHACLSPQRVVRACLRAWLSLVCCAFVATAGAESPIRSIDVTYDGDTYLVNARMFAPVSPSIAWDVLTDFAHMTGWVPNLRESSVVKPGEKKFTISQSGTAKFGILSFPYSSVREIELTPQTSILSTQVEGSMKRQQSLMVLSADGAGTRLQYRLELVPGGLAATVLSQDRIKRDLEEQFTAIVGEMVKRAK
jgi:hypothetical protein